MTEKFCQYGRLYSFCGGKSYDVTTEYCDGGTVYEGKGEFTDLRDGKTYRTVKIGSQIWMVGNLNYDYNRNTAKSYCYNNDTANCTKYGRLYLWSAAMDSAAVFSDDGKGCGYNATCTKKADTVRGACPEGWHLPSFEEWDALATYVAYNSSGGVGYALKSKIGWSSNGNGSDAFGFGARPAGFRDSDGRSNNVQSNAYFWSSTESSTDLAYSRFLDYGNTDLVTHNGSKNYAHSVRCVKD